MTASDAHLLDLLQSAPDDDPTIQGLAASFGRDGLSRADVQQLRAEVLQVRQQRETAQIIAEVATNINAAVDVDETLELVCHRSKHLLGSDMAYISLNDQSAQETYIRTTDGVLTPEYRGLRMPLGTGILGQAAGGSTIAQTTGYLDDSSFPHIPKVDEAVRLEGVVSILAVTMRVKGERSGALLVAERRQRRYTPQEVDLLSQIAGLAAVALQRTGLINDLRASLSERDEARAEAEARHRFLARIETFDQTLFEVLRHEGSPAELAQVISAEIGVDVRYLQRSEVKHLRVDGAHRSALPSDNHRTIETEASVVCAAVAGERTLGAFEARGRLDHDQRVLLERSGPVLTAIILSEERGIAASAEEQQSLITRLEQGASRDWKQISRQLQRYWLREGSKVRIISIGCDDLGAGRAELRELAAPRGGIAGESGGLLVAIGENLTGEEIERGFAGSGLRSSIAEVETVLTASQAEEALLHTRRSVRVMQALDLTGVADPRWDLGLTGLLLAHLPASTAADLVHHAVAPLLSYDRAHGSVLLDTAWVYLENDGNAETTARAMHVHANTVRQRVRRIAELIHPDWASGRRRTDLHTALRLWRVRRHETDKASRTR